MRIMLNLSFPTERFNEALKAGTIGPMIKKILEKTKPEAAYFGGDRDGERGAVIVVDIPTAADLSSVTEPWFLGLGAKVSTTVVMTPDEVGNLELDEFGREFG